MQFHRCFALCQCLCSPAVQLSFSPLCAPGSSPEVYRQSRPLSAPFLTVKLARLQAEHKTEVDMKIMAAPRLLVEADGNKEEGCLLPGTTPPCLMPDVYYPPPGSHLTSFPTCAALLKLAKKTLFASKLQVAITDVQGP